MDSIPQDSLQALQALIDGAARVSVLGHTHPDGDALGSTAALAVYLREVRGKDAVVLLPDTPADNLRFILPSSCPLLCGDTEPEAAAARIGESDLIFLLDCNAFSRTEGLEPSLKASKAPKVLIDHHLNPQRECFDLVFSTPDISSASELLYWVLKGLAAPASATPLTIGTCLLAGMTTDTNNFANSVYPSTFRMASELIAAGVDRDALLLQLYSSYRENRVRLFGYMQTEGLRILGEAACMILTKDTLHRFDVREGETEGLVNVPLSIAGVRLSIFLKEDNGHFRVSIRSKKGTSAQRLAAEYFHGGGHENAAGGKLFIGADIARPEDAANYVESALKSFLR
jgi:phosphoesterase RecJ-like protein